MQCAIASSFVAMVVVASTGCHGSPGASSDAADVDAAAIDAQPVDGQPVDARAIDAAPDANPCAAANTIDVSADPTLPLLGWTPARSAAAPVPGATDGSLYYCADDHASDITSLRSWVMRSHGDSTTGEMEGVGDREMCGPVLALDDHRVVTVRVTTFPPGHGRLLLSDFTAHTSQAIPIPIPSGFGSPYEVQAIPGGFLARGVIWPDATLTNGRTVVWQMDDAGAVVHTWLDAPWGVVVPTAAPITFARIDGADGVALVELASGAVVGTRTLPMHIDRLAAGSQGVIALGTVGCDVAAMPIDSTVATVLPGVHAYHADLTLDDRGRVVVTAGNGDDRTFAIYRLDDARFDGADGASRIDPAFGASGHARIEISVACEPAQPACPPGSWHRRAEWGSGWGGDRLRVWAWFTDFFPAIDVAMGRTYRMP